MIYEIRWDIKAHEVMRNIEKDIAIRIFNKVDMLKDTPFHFLKD